MSVRKITLQNSRKKMVVGTLRSRSSDTLIIMCPGACDDKSSHGRFDINAHYFTEAGFSTLSLDFCGTGESDDDPLTVAKEVDDLTSTLSWAKEKGFSKIGLFGHSLGGMVSLMAFCPDVHAIVMIGGLTGPRTFNWNEVLPPEKLEELREKGFVTLEVSSNMARDTIVLDKDFFEEFDKIDQQRILARVDCPVLMIHGDADEEERIYTALSQSALSYLSPTSKVTILPGASHGFWGHIEKASILATEWFREHVPL